MVSLPDRSHRTGGWLESVFATGSVLWNLGTLHDDAGGGLYSSEGRGVERIPYSPDSSRSSSYHSASPEEIQFSIKIKILYQRKSAI